MGYPSRAMLFRKLVSLLILPALLAGCGYRLAARKGDVGAGKVIAVPTFANRTFRYRIEQQMSEAVRRELARTTHYRVTSEDAGDVIVRGEILEYSTSPTTFDDQGRALQYSLTVRMKILVTNSSDGQALMQNDSMTIRENFQLSRDAGDFVPEDPAAVERLAGRFASALVASLVHRES